VRYLNQQPVLIFSRETEILGHDAPGDNHMKKTLAAVTAFSIAFGFVEAAVVFYIRLLYYPGGFSFPLVYMPPHVGLVEVAREASTIVMLAAAGWISGRRPLERFAFFAFAFGVWDIFYYVFLKVMLDWPASLMTWDVLFLIPVPWLSPVLAPVIVSLCLVGGSIIMLHRESGGCPVQFSRWQWLVLGVGGLLIITSFLVDSTFMVTRQVPETFNWMLFCTGVIIGIAGVVWALRNNGSRAL
jgi:hypothetical protein